MKSSKLLDMKALADDIIDLDRRIETLEKNVPYLQTAEEFLPLFDKKVADFFLESSSYYHVFV